MIPSCDAISTEAWEQIEKFASTGGKVLFWGRKPTMLVGRTFTEPSAVPDTPDWLYEPSVSWTRTVAAAMPEPEMKLLLPPSAPRDRRARTEAETAQPDPASFIRYTRRVLDDGAIYLIFNEGEQECSFKAEFDAAGAVREWNAATGDIKAIDGGAGSSDGRTVLEMTLAPWESRIISFSERQ